MSRQAWTGALHVLEHNALVYRRTWRGSVFVSFAAPVMFLAAMGVGLGTLVNRGTPHGIGGFSYLEFLAPGLLATATMQTAFSETTYRLLSRIRWARTYDAMLATPLEVQDVLTGELVWLAFRLLMVATFYFVAMFLFRTLLAPGAVLAIPVAVLNGLAFAAPIFAFTASQQTDAGFPVIGRFVIAPLSIFAGTFFPIDRLPVAAQAIAWLTPLTHGVALSRGLTLGTISMQPALVHLAVLLLYTVVGIGLARVTLSRRLAP
ncbi:MAG TPA: ABC transporter permease [Candidatus Dormibacteraeota bacterium]